MNDDYMKLLIKYDNLKIKNLQQNIEILDLIQQNKYLNKTCKFLEAKNMILEESSLAYMNTLHKLKHSFKND